MWAAGDKASKWIDEEMAMGRESLCGTMSRVGRRMVGVESRAEQSCTKLARGTALNKGPPEFIKDQPGSEDGAGMRPACEAEWE